MNLSVLFYSVLYIFSLLKSQIQIHKQFYISKLVKLIHKVSVADNNYLFNI